ncbi:MAG: hypothetical protein WBB22_11295 [Anaerolineae bacterium]
MRRLPGEIEPAEARIDDVHRRVRLLGDFFFSFFEASAKQHLLRILSSLWDLS